MQEVANDLFFLDTNMAVAKESEGKGTVCANAADVGVEYNEVDVT
jgi:hypothetical protein